MRLVDRRDDCEANFKENRTHRGPETPYLYATPDDCNSVAAQVHEDTTADATSPDLTVRPAVLNSSLVCNSLLYPFVVSHILRYVTPNIPPQDPSD